MKGVFNDTYTISFSDYLYKSIHCGYSFELPQLVKAIQMSTHNIYIYKVVNTSTLTVMWKKKGKRKFQGVPQSQTAALPIPQEEEETDKSKQAQTEQTYEKH